MNIFCDECHLNNSQHGRGSYISIFHQLSPGIKASVPGDSEPF